MLLLERILATHKKPALLECELARLCESHDRKQALSPSHAIDRRACIEQPGTTTWSHLEVKTIAIGIVARAFSLWRQTLP
jgi:hypothetical protein